MSRSQTAPWELTHPHQTSHHIEDDEDIKVPYDDLVDQYATPYAMSAQHKAYNVDPSAFDTHAPSYSLDHKPTHMSEATGKDLEGSTAHGHDWEYPPAKPRPQKEKEKESKQRTCMALVCCYSTRSCDMFNSCMVPPVHTRVTCLPSLPTNCSR